MHSEPCETLVKCREETKDRLSQLEEDVSSIKNDVSAMLEIIEAWNNGKGFINTVRIMSKIAVWAGITGAALTGIYQAIKHFGQS